MSFEKTVYNTIEEIGYIRVCVKITCPEHAEREVVVTISTSDNSASEPCYIPNRCGVYDVLLILRAHSACQQCVAFN